MGPRDLLCRWCSTFVGANKKYCSVRCEARYTRSHRRKFIADRPFVPGSSLHPTGTSSDYTPSPHSPQSEPWMKPVRGNIGDMYVKSSKPRPKSNDRDDIQKGCINDAPHGPSLLVRKERVNKRKRPSSSAKSFPQSRPGMKRVRAITNLDSSDLKTGVMSFKPSPPKSSPSSTSKTSPARTKSASPQGNLVPRRPPLRTYSLDSQMPAITEETDNEVKEALQSPRKTGRRGSRSSRTLPKVEKLDLSSIITPDNTAREPVTITSTSTSTSNEISPEKPTQTKPPVENKTMDQPEKISFGETLKRFFTRVGSSLGRSSKTEKKSIDKGGLPQVEQNLTIIDSVSSVHSRMITPDTVSTISATASAKLPPINTGETTAKTSTTGDSKRTERESNRHIQKSITPSRQDVPKSTTPSGASDSEVEESQIVDHETRKYKRNTHYLQSNRTPDSMNSPLVPTQTRQDSLSSAPYQNVESKRTKESRKPQLPKFRTPPSTEISDANVVPGVANVNGQFCESGNSNTGRGAISIGDPTASRYGSYDKRNLHKRSSKQVKEKTVSSIAGSISSAATVEVEIKPESKTRASDKAQETRQLSNKVTDLKTQHAQKTKADKTEIKDLAIEPKDNEDKIAPSLEEIDNRMPSRESSKSHKKLQLRPISNYTEREKIALTDNLHHFNQTTFATEEAPEMKEEGKPTGAPEVHIHRIPTALDLFSSEEESHDNNSESDIEEKNTISERLGSIKRKAILKKLRARPKRPEFDESFEEEDFQNLKRLSIHTGLNSGGRVGVVSGSGAIPSALRQTSALS